MASPAGKAAQQHGALAIVATGNGAHAGAPPGPPSPTKALIDHLSMLTAHKLAAAASQPAKKKKDQESSSDDDEDYPPDPQQCTVTGPGFAGGASGTPVKLYVHVKDTRGRRMKEGGDDVSVRVQYGVPAVSIPVDVSDNDDGSYTAVYTPPTKGNYQVTVEVNGISIGGSPFPVFFSAPPDPATLAAQQQAAQEQDGTKPAAPQEQTSITSIAAAAGISAVQAITDEHLRTLYVGNISPAVPIERLRELFTIFGQIIDLSVLGDRKDMAMVVFANKEAQAQGQQLNNTMFGDRPLNVTAPMSAMAAGIVPAHPPLAMQMQQIQQMQQTLLQSQKLAAQVAQMRAYNKSGVVMREDPQKAAQEAAQRLMSKLTGGSRIANELVVAGAAAAAAAAQAHMPQQQPPAGGPQKDQDRSRRGDRDRSRSRSPGRRRSRSRDRRQDNRGRDYHQDRDRGWERERRERELRERELREVERRQQEQRERERERQRAREREREKDRQRERLRNRVMDLEREETRKERRRSRSRSRDSLKDKDASRARRDREAPRDERRDRDREAPRDRSERDAPRDKADRDRADRDRREKDRPEGSDRDKDRPERNGSPHTRSHKDDPDRDAQRTHRDKDNEAGADGEGAAPSAAGTSPSVSQEHHAAATYGHAKKTANGSPPRKQRHVSAEPEAGEPSTTLEQPAGQRSAEEDGKAAPAEQLQEGRHADEGAPRPASVAEGAEKRHRHKERSYRTKRAEEIAQPREDNDRHRSKSRSRSPRRKESSHSKKSSHKKERKRDRDDD